jgi:PAS domain S-box-containing protein
VEFADTLKLTRSYADDSETRLFAAKRGWPAEFQSMSNEVSQTEELLHSQKAQRETKPNRSLSPRSPLASGQVAVRLGLAFSLLVGLLVAVGELGLRGMDQINSDLQDITGGQWTKMSLAREAVTYSNRNSRITMQVFLLQDDEQIGSLLAARAENSKRIATLIAELESLCNSEEEKRLLRAVKDARGSYIDSYRRALYLLVAEKKHDAAAAVMVQQTTPALLKYHAAWDEFVRFQGEQLELAARQSRERYAAARRLALFIVVVAVMLATAIALLVIRRMLREITAHLRTEKEALRTTHQEAEVFIDAVPSILIGMDHNSRITRWNPTAANAFGLPREEVAGKQLTDCGIRWLRPGMQDEVRSWCSERVFRRCDQVPFEMNGETRLLGLTITPVKVADKNMTELLIIGSDITSRSALEEQLRQAQKLESVGQLAAGIAHEINTPTQYIGDNVRFLKDAFQDLRSLLASYEQLLLAAKGNALACETVQEVVAAVERADTGYLLDEIPKAIEQTLEGVTRVSRLVSAMKEFSHPGAKEKNLVDLNHAIESTITVARNEWKYVADLETEFDPALPLIVCHVGEFNQVILNLIVNAAHAIADVVGKGGSEKGKIKVQTRNCPEWAEIRIQDTGSGIPEKVRARIFDPFFTTKEIGKGTGQGLAIARSVVVHKHNGSIHFETEEGKGTTFVIRLPHDGKTLAAKAVSA